MILLMHLLFAFSAQQMPTSDIEEILQRVLDVPALDHVLEKSTNGEYLDLAIVTNGLIPSDIDVSKNGKKLSVAASQKELSTKNVFLIKKLKFNEKKAIACINYKDSKIKVNLIKNGKWTITRYKMKNQKDNINVTF